MDPRVQKLARLLIHYSLELKKGQWLKIAGEMVTYPLMKAAYEEATKVGANVTFDVTFPDMQELLLIHGKDEQLQFIPPTTLLEAKKIDALLVIWGTQNASYLSKVDPKRQALRQKTRKAYMNIIFDRIGKKTLNWVGTQFPTQADAQLAEMSLSNYEDFVYTAGHMHESDPIAHWRKLEKEHSRLKKILDKIDQLHIRSNDTDLKLRVKERSWISCAGQQNFPDGEIFTSPIETSAEGHIRYSFPAVYGGREVENVSLQFKAGKVVKESASKNGEYLTAMLNMDKGARFLGEVAIGTNYEIKRFSRNTLFDEKIGGTCHLAVGAGFPESGGKNKSGLHWDMVCDLKSGGEIVADGKTIYRNGKFTI